LGIAGRLINNQAAAPGMLKEAIILGAMEGRPSPPRRTDKTGGSWAEPLRSFA